MVNHDIKAMAIEFLELAASGRVDEAYDKYVGARFVHHNPYFAAGRESLKSAMAAAAKEAPNELFEVQRALRDGDLVAVHSRLRKRGQAVDIAVVHLFRFEEGEIAELWDVVQVAPESSPNESGMF